MGSEGEKRKQQSQTEDGLLAGVRGGLQRRPVGGLSLHKAPASRAGQRGDSRDDAWANVVGLRRAERMKRRWGFERISMCRCDVSVWVKRSSRSALDGGVFWGPNVVQR